jgi:signal transduction histidine kinase
MKTRHLLFWRVGLIQALIETCVLGALLTTGLLLVGERIPPNALDQAFLFLISVCVLWCVLRLRLPEGRWGARLLREGAAALGLSLVLGGGLPALMFVVGWGDRLAWANLGASGVVLILIASGPTFAVLRVGVWLWHCWNRLRRRRLLWALTHAHLTLVVVVALLVATLGGFQIAASVADTPGRFSPDWAPAFVDLLARTVFPFVGVAVVMLVVLLAVLLPPSAIFSYFVARRTTRRLESLAAAATALRRGDLAARVPVEGEDEVAQLQAAFNAMAADLERATREIQAERDKVITLLQSRRDLIANVSHELRTPVATIRGYLESALADDGEVPSDDQDLRHDLVVMEGEVERLQGLIDDLFTLARAEVDGLALNLQPIDVGPVVRGRVEAMAPLAWQGGWVEVVAEVPPELPAVLADPDRLEQVLVNLLRNGVRHTPPGGIVAVLVAVEEDSVRIEVRDTGEGIPPEDMPHVWERFYRGAEARVKDNRGAGLGLALVKELTEAMGGTVEVESILGQGSCFIVRLPRA